MQTTGDVCNQIPLFFCTCVGISSKKVGPLQSYAYHTIFQPRNNAAGSFQTTGFVNYSVVYRFFTPPLSGIGKLPALAGRYFRFGITVGIFMARFGGNTF